jgi:tRNA 2-thiouridine synthesizing protein C
MESILIVVDKAPYGYEDTFSAFYVSIACLNKGMEADVLLIGDGVYAAINGQKPGGTVDYPNVGELSYLIFPESKIFVHSSSLKKRSIEKEELIEAAEIIDDVQLSQILLTKTKNRAFVRL